MPLNGNAPAAIGALVTGKRFARTEMKRRTRLAPRGGIEIGS